MGSETLRLGIVCHQQQVLRVVCYSIMRACLLVSLLWAAAHAEMNLPATMKGGALTRRPLNGWNGTLNLKDLAYLDFDVPRVTSGHILVKVEGSTVGPFDWKEIEWYDYFGFDWSFPKILGGDWAGTVVALGEGVTRFRVGDRVWGIMIPQTGAYGEYLVTSQDGVQFAPTRIPLVQAAVLPSVGLTAISSYFFSGAPWINGPTVVVLGGSGGCGHIGIQLAKAWGAARVITTCGPENIEFCQSMGADQVIDYKKQDWHSVIPAKSVDIVYDTVGLPGTGDLAYDILRDHGYFIPVLEEASVTSAKAATRPSIKQYGVDCCYYEIHAGWLSVLKEVVDAGKVQPYISATFPMSEFSAAWNMSMGGHAFGKISIVLNETSNLMIM